MNSFERQAFLPPAPRPFTVLSRYGTQDKFKVYAYGKTRIMTREDVLMYAASIKALGGAVTLNGLINID